jgi:hypothetical protein
MRIWSINEGKLFTLAYIAESSQYDRYLPTFQRMVDSFSIADNGSGSSSDRNREDNNGGGNCDRISYPDSDICIPPYPPDLNCPDVPYKNFQVTGRDPHGFDRDNDGIGCDSADGGRVTPPENGNGDCDASYSTVCIKSPPPDLNCGDIRHKNFRVTGTDPHGFDRDNDGIGCESANREDLSTPTPTPGEEPPTECPDGTIVQPGEECPPEDLPIDCPDGSTVQQGEECPDPPIEDPPIEDPPIEDPPIEDPPEDDEGGEDQDSLFG